MPTSALNSKQKLALTSIEVKEPGYIFAYLSYESESNQWIYFDDFKVTHHQARVLQYNEYYPYGLQTGTSWTRGGHSNNFLFNAGSELNTHAGWYETMFRGYDAALGRFLQVDPLAHWVHRDGPYAFGSNNPVMTNDPLGLISEREFRRIVAELWTSQHGGRREFISSGPEPRRPLGFGLPGASCSRWERFSSANLWSDRF